MVKKILGLFNKEITGLHQAAYLLGFFAICSQILALLRDRILASQFGAGNMLDIYYSAFRIPDILFVTVASIVSVSVLIPFLMEKAEQGEVYAKKFVDTIFSFFFVFIILICTITFFLAPFFLRILFPVFYTMDSFGDLVLLTRVLLLSPIFLGFSNLLASITQMNKRFLIYALSPVVYNIGIIVGIVVFYPLLGIAGLGLGVALGAFLHFGIQIPFIAGQKMFPKLSFPIEFNLIKKVIITSIPRTITVSSNEISKLFLISLAALLVPGSVSIFNFSFNLQSVPFSIIGISYALAAFPVLIKLFNEGDTEKFVKQMIVSSQHIIFWSVPITVMFIVLRAQIVRTLLGAGMFDWGDTRLTAAALAIFTLSLVAQNLMNLFVRAYYSRGITKTPLVMNIISTVIIIATSYSLVYVFNNDVFFSSFIESLFKVSDIAGTVVLMLPLGFTFGVLLNMIIHWIGFGMEFPTYSRPVLKTLFQITGASLIMGYVTYIFLNVFDNFLDLNTFMGIFLQGLCAGIIGIIALVCVLVLLKSKELTEVWNTLHRKIWKAKIVPPDAVIG